MLLLQADRPSLVAVQANGAIQAPRIACWPDWFAEASTNKASIRCVESGPSMDPSPTCLSEPHEIQHREVNLGLVDPKVV